MWVLVLGLLLILAVLLPPLAVFVISGLGRNFWINLILTVLFWLPGVVHAICLVLARRNAIRSSPNH
jgi:uncharacterized membrane protein YqaE (UPF0057 family)